MVSSIVLSVFYSLAITTMTTITTGISTCCCNVPLITTTYKEGAGDTGYTSTCPTGRGSKGDEILVRLWGRLSKLQVVLGQTIPLFIDDDTRTCLEWVCDNIRSMSSLAYLEGASDTHAFPVVSLSYMEKVIAERKVEMGNSQSFIQWRNIDLLCMEGLWAQVRDTELLYREWSGSANIHSIAEDKVQLVLTLLNRLSSYLWWSMRHENKLRGLEEKVWQGYVTPFPFKV